MRIIRAEDIRAIFTMQDAIEADCEAFTIQAQGHVELPMRVSFDVGKGDVSSFMPAFVSSLSQAGIKIVSTYPSNMEQGLPVVSATVILLDPKTGAPSALIDGAELTRIRTGAVSGLATKLLANEDAEVGALFGTGGQAMSQLEAILTVRKLREVRVFDVAPARVTAFVAGASEVAERFETRVVAAQSANAAIDEADVITTVTTSATPVFNGGRVKPGAHINAVGVFMPHKRELDETLITRADRIFIDNWAACMAEAGDIIIPMNEGKLQKKNIAGELGDLILGRVSGRGKRDDITIMKTVGFGTLDIVAGRKIFEKAVESGVGILLK